MNNQDYQRGYLDGQMNRTGVHYVPRDTSHDAEDLALMVEIVQRFWPYGLWMAAFFSVLWFWGFYPMVAAIAFAFTAKAFWPERFWEHGRKWWLLAALALLPYLGHAAFGIPAAVNLSQHSAVAHSQQDNAIKK